MPNYSNAIFNSFGSNQPLALESIELNRSSIYSSKEGSFLSVASF